VTTDDAVFITREFLEGVEAEALRRILLSRSSVRGVIVQPLNDDPVRPHYLEIEARVDEYAPATVDEEAA
jgi:hypothetical protein